MGDLHTYVCMYIQKNNTNEQLEREYKRKVKCSNLCAHIRRWKQGLRPRHAEELSGCQTIVYRRTVAMCPLRYVRRSSV